MKFSHSTITEKAQNFYNKYCCKHLRTYNYDYAFVSAKFSYQTATKRAITYKTKEEKNASLKIRAEEQEKLINFLNKENFELDSIIKLSNELRKDYQNACVNDFLYGNAQKWVNMAIKYYLISRSCPNGIFDYDTFKHLLELTNYSIMPVDGIMIKKNREILKINFNHSSWSKCDDLKIFISYWSNLKKAIQDTSLIEYEILNW